MASLASISILIFLLPTIVIVTVAAFFIYKIFYDKHTNKVLESGETKKRRWIAPWALALIVLGAQLLLVAGVMFPVTLFMFDQGGARYVETTEDNPLNVDVSDTIKFVLYDQAYYSTGVLENEGVTIECYSKDFDDRSSNYIFIGTIECEKINGPVNVSAELVNKDNECYATAECTLMNVSSDTDVIYFMCECHVEGGESPELNVGVNYGTAIYSAREAAVQFTVTL